MVNKFDEFVEHAVSVEHASQKTGIAVEEFSKLEFAAKNAGVGSEQLASGMEKFAKNAELAAEGSKKQAEAFAAIGVSVEDSSGHLKPMSELLNEVADKFESYRDSAEKTALAQALFGKAGADLIPLLNEGSKGIEAYGARAQELGIVLDEKTTKSAEAFHQKLIEVHAVGDAFWQLIAGQLLPTLTAVADNFVKGGQGINKFTSEVEPLITGLKIIVDVGYSVERTLMDIGNALGALTAIAISVSKGHFAEAAAIWKDYNAQAKQSESESNDFLKKLWSEQGDSLFKLGDQAEQAGEKVGKGIAPHLAEAFSMAKELSDVLDEIDKKSREKTGGAAGVDMGNKAADDASRTIQKSHDQWIKFVQTGQDSVSQLQKYANQAATGMQDQFAKFLFDPFKGGTKGMLTDFMNMIRKMIAEALSAQIMKKLFGEGSSGAGGGSGLGGLLGGALSSMFGGGSGGGNIASGGSGADFSANTDFGGAMASGGSVSAGQTYLVGEAGPELLTMGSAGAITPNHAMGGTTLNHSPTYNIDARGADAERIMSVMPGLLAQTKQETTRSILAAFRNNGMPAPRYA
jgi:Phage-related minor tail protein